MGVFHAPESEYAKELRKWEGHVGPYGQPGRPFRHQEFPKMVYRAGRTEGGPVAILDRETVANEMEERNLLSRGFFAGQQAALDAFHAHDREVATLAAERHYTERTMSEQAQREVAAHEAETDAHLPVIPETPIRRPGRPRKATAAE